MDITDTNDAIAHQIEKMEKEIPYLKGKKKIEAKRVYMQLLKSSDKYCNLNKPIYFTRK